MLKLLIIVGFRVINYINYVLCTVAPAVAAVCHSLPDLRSHGVVAYGRR